MAAVTVFVDDAVTGDLPDVCVIEGVPTAHRTIHRTTVGQSGLGAAWLLVFLGPVGWIILAVIALLGTQGEQLSVSLPMSDPAYEEMARQRRRVGMASTTAAIGALGAFSGLVAPVGGDLLGRAWLLAAVALCAGGIATAVLSSRRLARVTVDVSLDASRRWVVIERVHPAFAGACESRSRRRHPV